MEHYQIHTLHNGSFSILQENTRGFKTIPKLICHYKNQRDFDTPFMYFEENAAISLLNLGAPCKMQATNISREASESWEIEKKAICLLMKLNTGQFSEVWIGKWSNATEVAVKVCKLHSTHVNKFYDEISFMKKLRHPNILQLYAVCTKEEPIYIITELMKHGSLLKHLRDDDGLLLKLFELLDIGEQVASGMSYLEKKNYVHRNLAAKSILVSEKLICKVANFDLARVTSGGIFRGPSEEKLAIRWTAPEALIYRDFTIKSDVWSFGILLYELITYGGVPYHGMSDAQVLAGLQRGYRMPGTVDCPDYLYKIMKDCWNTDAASRPTFESLLKLNKSPFVTFPGQRAPITEDFIDLDFL